MAEREKPKRPLLERMEERYRRLAHGDPELWQYPVVKAVMSLLETGEPVTAQSLIDRIRQSERPDDIALRRGTLDAAIERLSKFLPKVDE